jgi:hypothetical protein
MAGDWNKMQRFVRRGWYQAVYGDGTSRIVYIDHSGGYRAAIQALGVKPHWAGYSLDGLINEEENSTVIAPDDWEERPRQYGIGVRKPDTIEHTVFGKGSQYKKWQKRKNKQMANQQRRTRPPGGGHYGPSRDAMASHTRPYLGNINFDRRTANQYNIGPSPRVGLLA